MSNARPVESADIGHTYRGGCLFSTGWWVSIEFLRDVHPTILELASHVHLSQEQTTIELDAWSRNTGLMYGVKVNVEEKTYETA